MYWGYLHRGFDPCPRHHVLPRPAVQGSVLLVLYTRGVERGSWGIHVSTNDRGYLCNCCLLYYPGTVESPTVTSWISQKSPDHCRRSRCATLAAFTTQYLLEKCMTRKRREESSKNRARVNSFICFIRYFRGETILFCCVSSRNWLIGLG